VFRVQEESATRWMEVGASVGCRLDQAGVPCRFVLHGRSRLRWTSPRRKLDAKEDDASASSGFQGTARCINFRDVHMLFLISLVPDMNSAG
jgi:hypothetical protein